LTTPHEGMAWEPLVQLYFDQTLVSLLRLFLSSKGFLTIQETTSIIMFDEIIMGVL